MSGPDIPWSVRLNAKLWWPIRFLPPISGWRWRRVWVRYWESEGITEAEQVRWARECEEEETAQ